MSDEGGCPTCGFPVSAEADRCPGCGRVLGEQNRCPRCGNITGLRRSGAGYSCAACGAARERGPRSVVLEEGASGGSSEALARGGLLGLRLVGMGLLGAGVAVASLAVALLPGALGYLTALLGGGLLVGAGVGALRVAARARARLGSSQRAERELRIMQLAEEKGGALTVTDVARALGLGITEAEHSLTDMADGSRVWLEVSPEGIARYVFREVALAAGPRVRVENEQSTEPATPASEGDASGAKRSDTGGER